MNDTIVKALPVHFQSAQAVWPTGRRTVMNDFVGFRATVRIPEAAHSVILRLAASTVYRVFVDGGFPRIQRVSRRRTGCDSLVGGPAQPRRAA